MSGRCWPAWLLLVLAGCAASPTTARDAEPRRTAAVVAIEHRAEGRRLLGTGTVIHSDDAGTYVLTAGHVVAGNGQTRVIVPRSLHLDGAPSGGTVYPAFTLIKRYDLQVGLDVTSAAVARGEGRVHDYAVLQLQGASRLRTTRLAEAIPGQTAEASRTGPDEPPRRARARAETLHFHEGVARLQPLTLALEPLGQRNPFVLGVPLEEGIEVVRGMSGSPVLSNGRMIAMVIAISDAEAVVRAGRQERQAQVAILIGAPAIVAFLRRSGLGALARRQSSSSKRRRRTMASRRPSAIAWRYAASASARRPLCW